MRKNILDVIDYRNYWNILYLEVANLSEKIYQINNKRELNKLRKEFDIAKKDLELIEEEINEKVKEIVLQTFEKHKRKHIYPSL